MLSDRYGLPLSTSSVDAAEAFVEAIDLNASFNDAIPALERAIAADEGFALAFAVLAGQRQQRGDAAGAASAIDRAVELAAGTSAREQSFISCVAAMVPGSVPPVAPVAPLTAFSAHLAEYPRDIFIVQQRNLAAVATGATDRWEQALAFVRELEHAYGDDWAFNGISGMALQENGFFDEARRRAEMSLEARPVNAMAMHPLVHVYYERAEHEAGEKVLGTWLQIYDWNAPYHCHLSWHRALFALSLGQYSDALAIWHTEIAPAKVGTTRLLDSASLLWRLKIYDCWDGPLDWESMRAMAEAAMTRPGLSFPFSHAALFCCAVGDTAALDKVVDQLDALGGRGHPLAGGVIKAFVLGLRAFSDSDYDTAAQTMEPFAGDFNRIGGSSAQCEVYVETFIEACLRAGRYEWAETAIRSRLGRRPSARDELWLSRSLAGQTRREESRAAALSAQDLWTTADAASNEQRLLASLAG